MLEASAQAKNVDPAPWKIDDGSLLGPLINDDEDSAEARGLARLRAAPTAPTQHSLQAAGDPAAREPGVQHRIRIFLFGQTLCFPEQRENNGVEQRAAGPAREPHPALVLGRELGNQNGRSLSKRRKEL